MRFVRHGGVAWPVGELVPDDGDGVVVGPRDERLRQVVAENLCCYASSTWVSRDGACYQRTRAPGEHGAWRLVEKRCSVDAGGALTVQVGGGGRFQVMKLARAIALAWIDAPRLSCRLQACALDGVPLLAEHIGWVKQGVRPLAIEETHGGPPAALPHADDEWVPLRYTWRFFNGDPIHVFRAARAGNFSVSRRGWVRAPSLRVSRGRRAPDGRMWFHVPDEGAVWVDAAVLESFVGPCDRHCHAAHRNGDASDNTLDNLAWQPAPVDVPKSVGDVIDLMLEPSFNAEHACQALAISRQALWSRLHQAAVALPRAVAQKRLAPCILKVARAFFDQDPRRAFVPFAELDLPRVFEDTPYATLPETDRYGMCLLTRELAARRQWAEACDADREER